MRQLLHLLIVDRERLAALASRFGSRWILPVLSCDERARADPSIADWMARQNLAGGVAGHWLGRVTASADGVDWLVAIAAAYASAPGTAALQWMPIDALTPATALVDYQGWAMAAALQRGRLPSVSGPFGSMTWLDEVKAWIGRVVSCPEPAVTSYRATPHEVVLGCETRRGRVYFKGLSGGRGAEARLTRALWRLAPDAFARTLAFEQQPGECTWWLASECPGWTLSAPVSMPTAEAVARALASLQQRVIEFPPVLRELRPVDLEAAAAWAAALPLDACVRAAIADACAYVRRAGLPESWIPLDLDPVNVLVDEGGGVRFIDLDDSFVGPAPLAMAVFARRCRAASRECFEPYEQAWSPVLKSVDWPGVELAAATVEAWLGWRRVVTNTRRGVLHGGLDLAVERIAARLDRDVHRLT